MSDVRLTKVASIQRSVQRAREEFAAAGNCFVQDLTRQDAAILNVLRACETAIDLANLLVRERQLGILQSSRDGFRMLGDAGLITPELATQLQKMVGFRNVAVHRYRDLDLAMLCSIIERDLEDLPRFSELVARSS